MFLYADVKIYLRDKGKSHVNAYSMIRKQMNKKYSFIKKSTPTFPILKCDIGISHVLLFPQVHQHVHKVSFERPQVDLGGQ